MTALLLPSVDFLPQIGGVSLMAHHLANALVEEGATVHVLAPRGAHTPEPFAARYALIEDREATPTKRLGQAWRRGEADRVRAVLCDHAQALDIDRIVLMHPFYYGPAAAGLVGARGRIPVSMYFHGFELRSQITLDARQKALRQALHGDGPTLRALTLSSARQMDEILVNSRYTARLVAAAGIRRPVFVTGCGVSRADYERERRRAPVYDRDAKRALRRRLGLPHDRPVVGTMGRLVASKNVRQFLEALVHAPHMHGVVVGDGPETEALHAGADALGLRGRVTWLAAVSETHKWDVLASLDAFCLVSKKAAHGRVEGFGIVLLEAAAAGTPVIATPSGGMVDVVAHERTGLRVAIGDARALAQAWVRLAQDPDLAAGLVRRARRQIEARYNWPAIAATLLRRWALGG